MKLRNVIGFGFILSLVILAAFRLGSVAIGGSNEPDVDVFIESQAQVNPNQRVALKRYANYLRDILAGRAFDELREIACLDAIAGESSPQYRELELRVKGRVLNSLDKVRKYYEHDAKFSGRLLEFPEVTREDCLR